MKHDLTEERLRRSIRAYITEQSPIHEAYLLSETRYAVNMSTDEFKAIFIDPWKTFLEGVKVEAKKFASSAVMIVRLMFTLNQKRAEEIVARHKDRMKEFQKETDAIMEKLGGDRLNDLDLYNFLTNPGAVIGKALFKGGVAVAKGTRDFAKEIGLSDESIGTVKGEESEEDALIRRRDQKGPVRKALDALEQIFLLAGHSPNGNLLSEAVDEEMTARINKELMAGPLGPQLVAARKEMATTLIEFTELVKSIGAQNEFLAGIGSPEMLQNLVTMRGALSEFEALNPEGAKELSKMLDALQSDAQELAKSEEFQKQILEDVGEEREVSPEEIYEKALVAITGEAFSDQYKMFIDLINDNQKMLVDVFSEMFGDTLTDETVEALSDVVPEFKRSIRVAERILGVELRS